MGAHVSLRGSGSSGSLGSVSTGALIQQQRRHHNPLLLRDRRQCCQAAASSPDEEASSSSSSSSSSSQGGSPLDSLDALDSLLTPPQSQEEEEEVSSSSSPSPSSSQQQQTPPSSSSLDDSDPYSTTPPPPWVLPGPRAGPLPPPKLQNKSKQQQSNPNNSNNSTPSEIRKEIKKQPLDENFYPNVGEAIRTLRDELPRVFQDDLSYDIYTDDVGLVDEFTGAHNHIYGKNGYKTVFKNIRIVAHVLFTGAHLDILRIWQPDERRITIRWTVRATPRLFGGWVAPDVSLDGISEYHLDGEGKVYQHVVERRDWDVSRMIADRAAQLWPNLAVDNKKSGIPSFFGPLSQSQQTTSSYDESS